MKNFQKVRLQTPRFIYFSSTPDHQIYNPETEDLAAERNGVRQWTEQALGDLKENTKDAWTVQAGEQLSEGISRQERSKRLVQAGDMAYPVVKGMLQGNKNWSAEKTEWSSVKNLPVKYDGEKVSPKPTRLAEMDLIKPGMEIEIKEIGGQMTVILRDEPETMLVPDSNAGNEAEAGVSDSATVSTSDSANANEAGNAIDSVVDSTHGDGSSEGGNSALDPSATETPASDAQIRSAQQSGSSANDLAAEPDLSSQSIPAAPNPFATEEPDPAVTPDPEVETPPSIAVPPSSIIGVPPNSQTVRSSADNSAEDSPPSPTETIDNLAPNLQQIAREAMTKTQNFESAESRPFNISSLGRDLEFDGDDMFDEDIFDGSASGDDKDWAGLSPSQKENVMNALNDWWEATRGPEFQRQQVNKALQLVGNEWEDWTSSIQNPFGSNPTSGRIIAIKFVASPDNVINLKTISGFDEIFQSLIPKYRLQLRDTLNQKWAEKISDELQKKLFNSIDFESLPTTNFNKPFVFTNGKIVFHENAYNNIVIFDSSNSEWAQLSLTDRMKLSTKLNQKFADN